MDPKRQSTRRDFLKGKAAAQQVGDALEQAWHSFEASTAESKTTSDAAGYLVQVSRRAMACEFQIFLNAGQYDHGTEAAIEALDLVDQLEDQLSIYREHSELSHVNRNAADGPVEVEPGLFALVEQSLRLHAETEGAFDITASPLSRAWGFFRRSGTMPDEQELQAALARVGSQHVQLDQERSTVAFARQGIEVSLNSIGKGYAVDQAGLLLRGRGIENFLFHGGQSSVLAAGTDGRGDHGWTIGLRHPIRPGLRLAEFRLKDRALATSGSGTQFFHYQGKRFGHLLDPRTGRPAEGVYSATVIAPTAAEADALSTAFYVLGFEKSLDYCSRHQGVAAVLVTPGQRSGTVEIHSYGLEAHEWSLLEETGQAQG